MPVLDLLKSQGSLAFGVVLLLLTVLIRSTSRDSLLRKDLSGATWMLGTFVVVRAIAWLLQSYLGGAFLHGVTLAWMLSLAYGVIRLFVALALFVVRLRRTVPSPKILRDVLDFTLYVVATLPILHSELHLDFSSLVATSAVASFVLGMALQDTLGNLFAGLSIQLDRPFQVGDFVSIKDVKGKVLQIGWRTTRVKGSLKEVVVLPNNFVAKEAVKNFSQHAPGPGLKLSIPVSPDIAPNRVKKLLMEIATGLPQVLLEPRPQASLDGYEELSLRYELKLFVRDPSAVNEVKDAILSQAWYRFRRQRIDLSTRRTLQLVQPEAELPEEKTDYQPLLDRIDLLADLPPPERARLAREVRPLHFGHGERIIEAGTSGETFYMVASGQVSVRTEKGGEVTRLHAGDYFGEMSLLTGEPRSATVVALVDSDLLEFQRPTFARLFADHPALGEKLSIRLAQRRMELTAHQEAAAGARNQPESSRILARLKQIFGF